MFKTENNIVCTLRAIAKKWLIGSRSENVPTSMMLILLIDSPKYELWFSVSQYSLIKLCV